MTASLGASAAAVRQVTADDVGLQLAYARHVMVVPGFGLAAAQAQHEVAELAALLTTHGTEVQYAIHPVAGRMPGHMNVLLAEANVPYTQMLQLEEANSAFDACDVALVIGANDVTNPAARRTGNALSGMPILDVDHARSVVVIKRSMSPGYAGIANDLFSDPKTGMLFADAKQGLADITLAVKQYVAA
ncbi:NAD(P)(+) transhydrogenase (Re/Si-specific) subunit beta [Lapillicoccus sp.]|uniref:NAD(P)(+) transhydrogenase (Re/Si-specific) subunit beta n=1 Tax=Lapillicoccus sp. TaxID=1909287 RepID=UPI0025DC3BE7|nr:NAD(P)(+) transhydrogenase (Re/Si-specific) subunit beta [Lapillicoccus sp.]